MDKHFMIDIESSGVDQIKDDILEIGLVEMNMEDGYWRPGAEFHTFVHSKKTPENQFARDHMVEIYKQANQTPQVFSYQIREQICSYFKMCGREGQDVLLCGWNASGFDVPFMHAKGYLKPPGYAVDKDGNDIKIGDHSYRVYELAGAIKLASDVFQEPYQGLKETIKSAFEMELPEGKQHDAIFDCYMQIKMLNGLIKMMREGR